MSLHPPIAACCVALTLAACAEFVPPAGLPGAKNSTVGTSPHSAADIAKKYAAQASCKGIGDDCPTSEPNRCCAGMACAGLGCCVRAGQDCATGADCCSKSCVAGKCACANTPGRACQPEKTGEGDCCAANGLECTGYGGMSGTCKLRVGAACSSDSACTTKACSSGGKCQCIDPGSSSGSDNCRDDKDCCSGGCFLVSGVTIKCCMEKGKACSSTGACCSGSCSGGVCK